MTEQRKGYIVTIRRWMNDLYLRQLQFKISSQDYPFRVLLSWIGLSFSLPLAIQTGEKEQWGIFFFFLLLGSSCMSFLIFTSNVSTDRVKESRRKELFEEMRAKLDEAERFLTTLSSESLRKLLDFCNLYTGSTALVDIDLSEEIEELRSIEELANWDFLEELRGLLQDSVLAKQLNKENTETPAEL